MIILAIALLVSVCLNVFLVLRLTTQAPTKFQAEDPDEPDEEEIAEWMELELDRVAKGTRRNPPH